MKLQRSENFDCVIRYYPASQEKVLHLPEGVQILTPNSFTNSPNLVSVFLPSSLLEIGWEAFRECASLKEVSLPDGECFISQDAFAESGVETVHIPANFIAMKTSSGRPLNEISPQPLPRKPAMPVHLPTNFETIYDYDAEDLYDEIDRYAFLREEAEHAWEEADNDGYYESHWGMPRRWEYPVLPQYKAPYVGISFLINMKYLKSVTVAEENPYYAVFDNALYDKAFRRMLCLFAGAETLLIPASCRAVFGIWGGSSLFPSDQLGGYALKEISVEPGNQVYSDFDGALYNKDQTQLIAVPRMKKNISYPGTLRTIGCNAFSESVMSEFYIPETVTQILESAFPPESLLYFPCHDRTFRCQLTLWLYDDYYVPEDEVADEVPPILGVIRAENAELCLPLFHKISEVYQQQLILDLCDRYAGNQEFYEELLRQGRTIAENFLKNGNIPELQHLLALKGLSREDASALIAEANQQERFEMQIMLMHYVSDLSGENPVISIRQRMAL